MRKKKIVRTILIIVLIFVLLLIGVLQVIYILIQEAEESKALTFYLPRSSSFASNWNYQMSDQGIIKETASETFALLHGEYDYFEFEAEQSGEVTIYFIAQYETQVVEEDCFSITYYVNENGNITEVSGENKPEKINFDDDTMGLLKLKAYNLCVEYVITRIFILSKLYYFIIRILR